MSDMTTTVAVIGLGHMGGAVAARLVEAGHEVRGFDLDAGARDAAATAGVTIAESAATATTGARAVLTSLPNSAIVRRAWLDAGGLVESADPGTVLIDLSTIDPETMRTLGRVAGERGLDVLDCPVSGGPNEARSGRLSLLVGGEPAVLDHVRDVLESLGTIHHAGGVGAGKVVKIVNNMMSMGNVLVAAEAFAVGVAAGVEPTRLYDILSVSGGTSHHFTKRWPKALAGDFEPGFSIELGEKDLALAIDLARTLTMPVPAASTARDLYALAMAEGYRSKDIVAMLEIYARWSGASSS